MAAAWPETPQMMSRLREWWWAVSIVSAIVAFLVGSVITGLTKFTVYYLQEQTAVTALHSQQEGLAAIERRTATIDERLAHIDQLQVQQHFSIEGHSGKLFDLADHVHALDARADNDRALLTDFLAAQRKNSEQILFLLDKKGRP